MDAVDRIALNNAGWYFVEFNTSEPDRPKGNRVLYVQRNGIELWFGFLGI